jgi:hypothetical protein
MRATILTALLLVTSCTSSHALDDASAEGADGGGTRADTGPGVDGGGLRSDSGVLPTGDGGILEPPPGFEVCGTSICGTGEICCTATGACFDPADPTACTVPPEESAPGACASNRDCAAGELCEFENIFEEHEDAPPTCVGGIGRCVMQRSPDKCGGFGDGVCGCDGRTYRDPCAASRVGVRVIRMVPCGTPVMAPGHYDCDAEHLICPEHATCDVAAGQCVFSGLVNACGIDEQCPDGQSCCGITGLCVESDCPDCCRVPPPGTYLPCRDAADCEDVFGSSSVYCGGPGCDAPGGCMFRMGGCGGVLAAVCGCDGVSYSNACWASADGIRIAHDGMCM